EYWSEALSNHHAFLIDYEHEIFFLPAGSSGYVFSYANDTIGLVKEIEGISTDRALYIDDCLYIIGDYKIVVLDENTWEEVSSLTLVNYTFVP
ncbi:MAG: beta-propeller domain-containing protein, partial [Candidatus Aenigmarchaeota archaeon]|nr:beta-propeller domain-containing protein [Candidatus Aenigmarchaeota archaeon]